MGSGDFPSWQAPSWHGPDWQGPSWQTLSGQALSQQALSRQAVGRHVPSWQTLSWEPLSWQVLSCGNEIRSLADQMRRIAADVDWRSAAAKAFRDQLIHQVASTHQAADRLDQAARAFHPSPHGYPQ
jgi:hypothetical protein